jgi:hypothetical protein
MRQVFKTLLKFLTGGKTAPAALSPDGVRTIRDLEGFVEYVARSLVDAPGDVRISSTENSEGCTIRIDCRKEDIGKIVGKRGKTIMAIRSLVSGAAGRMRQRVSVEVVD